jgi:hypothetical protein
LNLKRGCYCSEQWNFGAAAAVAVVVPISRLTILHEIQHFLSNIAPKLKLLYEMQHSTGSRLVNEAIVVFHTTIRPNRLETRYSSCIPYNIFSDSVCRCASCQPPLHLPNPAAAPFLFTISLSQIPRHTFLLSKLQSAPGYLSLNVRPISFLPLILITPNKNNLWHTDVSSAKFSVNSSR